MDPYDLVSPLVSLHLDVVFLLPLGQMESLERIPLLVFVAGGRGYRSADDRLLYAYIFSEGDVGEYIWQRRLDVVF